MGMAMDVTDLWSDGLDNIDLTIAVDALHPNDHTERVHLGSELVFMKRFALRAGYKFNHDVESLTLGLGVNFEYEGVAGCLDYAYGTADYFNYINRFSLIFSF
jgi:hypothetical protein